jgi:hypothetical protein
MLYSTNMLISLKKKMKHILNQNRKYPNFLTKDHWIDTLLQLKKNFFEIDLQSEEQRGKDQFQENFILNLFWLNDFFFCLIHFQSTLSTEYIWILKSKTFWPIHYFSKLQFFIVTLKMLLLIFLTAKWKSGFILSQECENRFIISKSQKDMKIQHQIGNLWVIHLIKTILKRTKNMFRQQKLYHKSCLKFNFWTYILQNFFKYQSAGKVKKTSLFNGSFLLG